MHILPCTLFCILSIFLSVGYASVSSHPSKVSLKNHYKDVDLGYCLHEAACKPIHNATCFGTVLPYSFTTVDLADDSISQFEVQDNLALWQGLRSVPRCWAVVQPLLCAVYMPKCENGSVFLPSQEMCRITRGPCKSVEVKHSWPPFLRCENKNLFPPRCKNPLQEVKFNTSYKCIPPLVETDNPDNWFHKVEGCGIQCQDPFFTEEEHSDTHYLISLLATGCILSNFFTVFTFMINWKTLNHYPGIVIFYINVCSLIACLGWLIQFLPGAREEVVCLHDGTIRRRQPRSGEHLCSITFVLIYSFLMAAIVWFVILTYAWHVLFRQSGAPKDIVKKKVAYFHLLAWCIPLVLTTTIMAMKEVDGDSMSGICFVGYANSNARLAFLLLPIAAAALTGGFFLTCVLYTLIKVKLRSEDVANLQVKTKIRQMIFKIGTFTAFAAIFIVCTFACHVYDFTYRKEWEESLREYIVCLAMNTAQPYLNIGELPANKCMLKNKPNVTVVQLHLFCIFGFGFMMSLWVWTRATVESWKRFLYGLCAPAEKSAIALKRHQLIAKAFQRRHEINQGHLSFSLNSTHEDPIGMNLEVNSIASRDISSSWAAALPQFLMRRNAVAGIAPFVPRHYSSASDVSRHISVDSFNQQNFDSLSMQISEQEYVAHALRHQRRKTRKERERFLRANRIAPWFPGSRRGSDTSLQSSLMAASIVAAATKNASMGAKVTKSTSTGDLGAVPTLNSPAIFPAASVLPSPPNRPLIQRPAINPPFTHGMTDNSHRLDGRDLASALGSVNASQRFTPSQIPTGLQNPLIGILRPPLYAEGYDIMNTMPFGYLGGSMYPSINGVYSGYPTTQDFNFSPYGVMPYAHFGACQNDYQPSLLPLHPRVDSASETEYFPIILSDSEFTDAGHRSHDESQFLSAQRLIPDHVSVPQPEVPQFKPTLEPQACAKTQFLKRMGSFQTKTNTAASQTSRPPSGRKSPHSEAPPPSPAESSKGLDEDEDDDVFEEPLNEDKGLSSTSLPQMSSETESIFQRLKSKFKRSTSFSQNCTEPETIELCAKRCCSSLGQLSQIDVMKNCGSPQKNTAKEKCLNISEGMSLLHNNEMNENISR